MAYDLGITAQQRNTAPVYSGIGGTVTAYTTGSNTYYDHRFTATSVFTNTSIFSIPAQIINTSGSVVTSTTVVAGGTYNVTISTGALIVRYPAPPASNPDPYFKNTTLLLTASKSPITSFTDDASTYNADITVVGNARPDSFNPYARNYSIDFDGSTNFLALASTSTVAFGTDDFTVEAWIYVTGTTGTYRTIYSTRPSDATGSIYTGGAFGVNPTGGLYWYTGEFVANNVSDLLLTNRWNHVAVVKYSGQVNLFLNGSVVPNTDSSSPTEVGVNYLVVAGGGGAPVSGDGNAGIGAGGAGGLLFDTINASFDVTIPVIIGAGGVNSNGSNSSFLTIEAIGGGRGGTFAAGGLSGGSGGGGGGRLDAGGGAGTVGQGNNGGAARSGDTGGQSAGGGGGGAGAVGSKGGAAIGGAGGIGRQIDITGVSTYYAGGGGGMANGTGGAGGLGGGGRGVSSGGNGTYAAGGAGGANTGGGSGGGNAGGTGGSGVVILSHPNTLPQATVTGGATITTTGSNIVYTFTASGTISFVSTSTQLYENELTFTTPTIGANRNGSEKFNGYISNLRVVKGQGLFEEAFTVGTQELATSTIGHSSIDSAITGTVVLLTAASNRFIDKSSNNLGVTTGTAVISKLQPFGYSYSFNGSIYFDGAGDYLSIASNAQTAVQSDNFTIEFWAYFTNANVNALQCIYSNYTVYATAGSMYLGKHSTVANGCMSLWLSNHSSSAPLLAETSMPPSNAWVHYALVRNAFTFTLYRNGEQSAIATFFGAVTGATNPNFIGAAGDALTLYNFPGYISNFRIVKGTAVYTSNFTLSTEPLPSTTGTVLLTMQNSIPKTNSTFYDKSNVGSNITAFGSISQGTFNPYGSGWSGYFDGSGDYLTVPFSSSFVFAENFTIEGWINPATLPALNSQKYIIASWNAGSNLRSFYVILQNVAGVNLLVLGLSSDGTSANSASVSLNWTPTVATWSHFAVVRTGATVTMYANGVSLGTGALATVNYSAGSAISIGADAPGLTAAYYWNGYLSNLRIVNGTAVYTGNFTPPASDLARIPNTVLLTLQNSRFVDNSENNFTITQIGNSNTQRFSPHTTPVYNSLINSGSVYFNGSTDFLTVPANSEFSFGTGDFTIECWVNTVNPANTNGKIIVDSRPDGTNGAYWLFSLSTTGVLRFVTLSTGGVALDSPTAIPFNQWVHVAATRSSGTLGLWINGVRVAAIASTDNISSSILKIGTNAFRASATDTYFNGHMSDLRIVKGTSLYIGPPIVYTPLTVIDNTVLLTAQSSTLIDNSVYGNTITGVSSITTSTPFATNISANGYYSYSFTNTQVLSVANTSTLNFGSNDFTIEAWVYPTTVAGENVIVSLYGYSNNRRSWYLGIDSGKVRFRTTNATGSASNLDSNATLLPNTWYFISAIKQATTRQIYINGQLDAEGSASATMYNNTVDPIYIGAVGPNLTGYFEGLISNLRILNGTANFPSADIQTSYAIPSAPAKAIPNTVLLLDGTDGAIVDQTGRNALAVVGDASLRRSLIPDNYSISFDGTGDYLNIPYNALHNLGSGDFTIEAWIYPRAAGVIRGIINNWQAGGQFIYEITAANVLRFGYTNVASGVSTVSYTGTTTIPINVWTHVAVVRNGSTITHYINGVIDAGGTHAIGAGTLYYYNGATKDFRIGVSADLAGYLDGIIADLRVVKGSAVYTANFTPSTTRLTAIANTLLLTAQNTSIRDYSSNNFTITVLGNTVASLVLPYPPINIYKTPYSTGTISKAMYFDGNGDYLLVPASPSVVLSSSPWTVECWVFPTGDYSTYRTIFAKRVTGTTTTAYEGYLRLTTGVISFYNGTNYESTTVLQPNAWSHCAWVYNGTNILIFVNGTLVLSSAVTITENNEPFVVGGARGYTEWFAGYLADFRITKGVARYLTNFATPYAPPPAR